MKKSPHTSVDGFVPRRASTPVGAPRRELGKPRAELKSGRQLEHQPPRRATTGLQSDIDQSLMAIDTEEEVVAPKRRRFLRRRKQPKAPLTRRRKIVKRLKWAVIIIVLLTAGYFGWKFIQTSGKLFNGNLFGLIQHKRLKEDANGRTNILVFGTSGYSMKETNGWDGAFLTDSIMLVSVDQDTDQGYTISLPRDLYVQHTCTNSLGTTSGKLNETFYCAYNDNNKSEKAGAAALMKTAGEITGLDVQYYVHADWTALKKSVDAVGGVDVKIESSDPRGIYDVATKIDYKNGQTVHLNGERALALARARNSEGGYGLPGGNFDREKNQQKILGALQKKATSAGTIANPAAVSNLLDALGDNVRTDFETSEIQALIDIAKNTEKLKSLPFVGRKDGPDLMTTGMYGGASIVQPTAGVFNYTDIHGYIKKALRGDKTAVIDVLNASTTTGLATQKASELEANGYIIGKVDNAPKSSTTPVRIYQLDETKTSVADALAKQYDVTITKGGLDGYSASDDTDFIIVFGG